VDALLHVHGTDVSLNEPLGGDHVEDGPELGETLPQGVVPAVEETIMRRTFRDGVRRALSELDDKEREVMALRFGLDDQEPRTLQEIGDRLKLSRERIRQIESRAKENLRRSKRTGQLRSYLN
jgi:RNA polymerase sigma factor (sigma-70 family)